MGFLKVKTRVQIHTKEKVLVSNVISEDFPMQSEQQTEKGLSFVVPGLIKDWDNGIVIFEGKVSSLKGKMEPFRREVPLDLSEL